MSHNQENIAGSSSVGILRQAVHFFAVGITATAVHLLVALAIIYIVDTGAFVANIGGYCMAFLISYLGHSHITFRREIKRTYFLRFIVINTALFITSSLVSFTMDKLEVNSYIGVMITVGILPPLSFLIHKFVTFRE